MTVTDPIADLLTRIRNAQQARHDVTEVPASKLKIAVTHILKQEGYIRNYKCIRDGKQGLVKIALRYDDQGHGVIESIRRMSRPSQRYYVKANSIPKVKNGFGVGIISTSQGVMSDREAREKKLGGEYLCSVF